MMGLYAMTSITLSFLFTLLLHLSLASKTRRQTAVPAVQLITSPESCITNVECPLDHYCKAPDTTQDDYAFFAAGGSHGASTCVPRLPEGSNCSQSGLTECELGTFCTSFENSNPLARKCVRQLPAGARCFPNSIGSCQGDLVCKLEPICRPFTFGFAGDFCQHDGHCQQKQGFYCDAGRNQCTAKKPPGAACRFPTSIHTCNGFCVLSGIFDGKPGICQRFQKAGEKCNSDGQCQAYPFSLLKPGDVDLICNRPTLQAGICVLETDLIRHLGAPCNPTHDECDARRGLSSARVGHRFMCVQRATSLNSMQHFCTPNSPLSSCPPDDFGNPRECRQSLTKTKQLLGTFACRNRRQVVPVGHDCGSEFATCPSGSVCDETPGVQRSLDAKNPPPPWRSCMVVVPVGAPCHDQFRFKCEDGSFCVNGTCRITEIRPSTPITFAPPNGNCSLLSCVPRTSCTRDPKVPQAGQFCKYPTSKTGLWQPCFRSALFPTECEGELQCLTNGRDKGVRACRPKRGIGGVCTDDNSCRGDLKCDPSWRRQPFKRRCYEPSLSLNVGDSCIPHPRTSDPRCVAQIKKDPTGQYITHTFPLSCLPKNGSNVCQRLVGLFEQCSEAESIACEERDLKCSNFNICVPQSQA